MFAWKIIILRQRLLLSCIMQWKYLIYMINRYTNPGKSSRRKDWYYPYINSQIKMHNLAYNCYDGETVVVFIPFGLILSHVCELHKLTYRRSIPEIVCDTCFLTASKYEQCAHKITVEWMSRVQISLVNVFIYRASCALCDAWMVHRHNAISRSPKKTSRLSATSVVFQTDISYFAIS